MLRGSQWPMALIAVTAKIPFEICISRRVMAFQGRRKPVGGERPLGTVKAVSLYSSFGPFVWVSERLCGFYTISGEATRNGCCDLVPETEHEAKKRTRTHHRERPHAVPRHADRCLLSALRASMPHCQNISSQPSQITRKRERSNCRRETAESDFSAHSGTPKESDAWMIDLCFHHAPQTQMQMPELRGDETLLS